MLIMCYSKKYSALNKTPMPRIHIFVCIFEGIESTYCLYESGIMMTTSFTFESAQGAYCAVNDSFTVLETDKSVTTQMRFLAESICTYDIW